MYRKLSLIAMTLGILFLGSVLVIALSDSPAVGAQEDTVPEFVGSATCGDCHFVQAEQQELHGHSSILTRVDGSAPEYPHGMELELPEGYTWDDISFVIGGFGWKARYIDQSGYIITGDEDSSTQYDLPLVDDRTGDVIAEARWVPYRAGQERPYTCGGCHNTGYNHDRNTNMYDMEGLAGQWSEEGVQCEECHGPGSLHVESPIRVNMQIDRTTESCGSCHSRGDASDIDARDGYLENFTTYDELMHTPHAALSCIDCHDAHQSSVYADEDVNPNQGMKVDCADCHFNQGSTEEHDEAEVTCVDCHMPPIVASGNRLDDLKWADMNSHLFQINTDPDAVQFTEDGESSMPYLTLEYTCARCHSGVSIGALARKASGYHEQE